MRKQIVKRCLLFVSVLGIASNLTAQCDFSTDYVKIHIDAKGYITSIKNITIQPNREFARAGNQSALLSLYNSKERKYYYPRRASYSPGKHTMTLQYANGSKAGILIEAKNGKYIKLHLLSLTNRKNIDAVEWGVHTNITNIFGELLGVARDTSAAVNYAIGLMSLSDNTTGGTGDIQGEIGTFGYLVHSPDKQKFPLPDNLKETQLYPVGGDGIDDKAFYSQPEEYYRMLYGNAAYLDTSACISLAFHATDRSKPRQIVFPAPPYTKANQPVHQEVPAVPGVDYIGSKVALWGCPDTLALMTVIQNIVLSEGLPYPTLHGKWVKDPARYIPDVFWNDKNYDSVISYTKQLGFKGIEAWSLGEFYPNRCDGGNIDYKEKVSFRSGSKTIKQVTEECEKYGISFGLHILHDFLQHNVSCDVSPGPNDSLCYLQRRKLENNIDAADTILYVDDPAYLDEVAGWEGHPVDANVFRIGNELVHYIGVSSTKPYTLLKVQRGYWGTKASQHQQGEDIYKLQTNCYGGLAPDIFLQDKYAGYYADFCKVNGMRYIDFDGEEDMYYQGMGEYSVKRFYSKLFGAAKQNGIDLIRITGATLSGGSWHYHSIWNVGGGNHMYNPQTRKWGIEGKDLRNVTFGSYFPSSFGGNFEIDKNSTVQEYENIQATSIGLGVTYVMKLSEQKVEACPVKYDIFRAVKLWENARAANAFPRWVKKQLADSSKYFHLEERDPDTWELFTVDENGSGRQLYSTLKRDINYK